MLHKKLDKRWHSLNSNAGRIADHWVKDESSFNCTACHVKFSIWERKHHSQDCGKVFCSKWVLDCISIYTIASFLIRLAWPKFFSSLVSRCSDFLSRIPSLNILTPVEVCFSCFTKLNAPSRSKRWRDANLFVEIHPIKLGHMITWIENHPMKLSQAFKLWFYQNNVADYSDQPVVICWKQTSFYAIFTPSSYDFSRWS